MGLEFHRLYMHRGISKYQIGFAWFGWMQCCSNTIRGLEHIDGIFLFAPFFLDTEESGWWR
jgi:hypothetical protein